MCDIYLFVYINWNGLCRETVLDKKNLEDLPDALTTLSTIVFFLIKIKQAVTAIGHGLHLADRKVRRVAYSGT